MSGESTREFAPGTIGELARRLVQKGTAGLHNAEFAASNKQFRAACDEENVEPTRRQASKWRMGKGRAFLNRGKNRRRLEDQKREAESKLYLVSTASEPDQTEIGNLQLHVRKLTERVEALR